MAPGGERSSGDGGSLGGARPAMEAAARPPASKTARSPSPPSQPGLPPSQSTHFPSLHRSQRRGRSRSTSRVRGRSSSRPPISSTPVDWGFLFKQPSASEDLNLKFTAPGVNNGVKVAIYEEGDSAELLKSWSMAVVGYVIGMHLSYTPLLSFLKSRWGTSSFELHILQNGFFVCKFDCEEDLRRALEGFWMIRGHPMILRRWTPNIRMEVDSLRSIPLWVNFHGLPLHLWTKEFIGKIASTLGEPLYLDRVTAERKRLAFARACIMISSNEELPDVVHFQDLDGSVKAIKVSYQWRPRKCSICSSFGHIEGACKPIEVKGKKVVQVFQPKVASVAQPNSGISTSNQFEILEVEDGLASDACTLGKANQGPLLKALGVQKGVQGASSPNLGGTSPLDLQNPIPTGESKLSNYRSPKPSFGSKGSEIVGKGVEMQQQSLSKEEAAIIKGPATMQSLVIIQGNLRENRDPDIHGMQVSSMHGSHVEKESNLMEEADNVGLVVPPTATSIREQLHHLSRNNSDGFNEGTVTDEFNMGIESHALRAPTMQHPTNSSCQRGGDKGNQQDMQQEVGPSTQRKDSMHNKEYPRGHVRQPSRQEETTSSLRLQGRKPSNPR